ncbi:MAG: hypothetical protein IT434_03265 [Phycisphaerales bacterium]|nr:hypothetical protein [Phycisphaerales bacterium]
MLFSVVIVAPVEGDRGGEVKVIVRGRKVNALNAARPEAQDADQRKAQPPPPVAWGAGHCQGFGSSCHHARA